MNPVKKKNEISINIDNYTPEQLKQNHVIDVYNKISKRFDKTRFCRWPIVDEFVRQFKDRDMILEVGVGNGRNLAGVKGCKFGVDVCDDFLKMSSQYGTMIKAEKTELPFEDDYFDYILSVAVFHHLVTDEERVRCAEEMMRVLKKGGKLFLEVFERLGEQEQDVFLRWKNPEGEYQRYYHRFEEEELKKYFGNGIIKRECNNIIIIVEK